MEDFLHSNNITSVATHTVTDKTMSSRVWNTALERRQLSAIVAVTSNLLLQQQQNDEDSSSSSDDSSTSSSSDDNSSLSESTIGFWVRITKKLASLLYTPTIDSTIVWHQSRCICDFNDNECIHNFRFCPEHLTRLFALLWPKMQQNLTGTITRIVCENRYVCKYETGMLILLYRLSRPRRLWSDMEKIFGMKKSHLCHTINTFRQAVYRLSLPYLATPSLFKPRQAYYAELVYNKSDGAINNVWGFIDGTLRRTCRPTYFQRAAYSGHKRSHGIKFQLVLAPDGLIVSLFGPIAGARHDSFMLGKSNLVQQLRDMTENNNLIYSLYGDPAYPQSAYILGGFNNPANGSHKAAWNTAMSKVRIVVEWGFNEIITSWRYLDFKASMKIFGAPIAQYYIIGGFFTNCRNCLYGTQTQDYFDATTLSLEEYINLVNK